MNGFSSLPVCLSFLFLSLCVLPACAQRSSYAQPDRIQEVLNKEELTAAVIDSGLGGLSFTAEAVNRMRVEQSFRKADFIFFNIRFSYSGESGKLSSRMGKVQILNSALQAVQKDCSPDVILIGSDTLSLIYPDTLFARNSPVPVFPIAAAGAALVAEKLKSHPDSRVIIFGNPAGGSHKKELVDKGFLDERIVVQECPDLSDFIERGYNSPETEMLIYSYVDQALQELNHGFTPFYVCFSCPHFNYSQKLWEKAFQRLGAQPLGYLSPNPRIIDFLFPLEKLGAYPDIQAEVKVVSLAEIPRKTQKSLGGFLREISPQTAEALQNYHLIPDLFEWRKFSAENKKEEKDK